MAKELLQVPERVDQQAGEEERFEIGCGRHKVAALHSMRAEQHKIGIDR